MKKFFNKVEIPFLCVVNLAIKRKHRDTVNKNNQVGQREGFAELGWLRNDQSLVVVVGQRQNRVSLSNGVLDAVPHEEANARVQYVRTQIEIL